MLVKTLKGINQAMAVDEELSTPEPGAKAPVKPRKKLFARWRRKTGDSQDAPVVKSAELSPEAIEAPLLEGTNTAEGSIASDIAEAEIDQAPSTKMPPVETPPADIRGPESAPESGEAQGTEAAGSTEDIDKQQALASATEQVSARQTSTGQTNNTGQTNKAPDEEASQAPEQEEPSVLALASIETETPKQRNVFSRALSKTGRGLETLFLGRRQIDDGMLEELETQLLMADVGVEVCTEIIDELTDRVKRRELSDSQALRQALHEIMVEILAPCEDPFEIPKNQPCVILVVGINGVGKTTTIGKLARNYQRQGLSVMLAAGDTFRAAAVEQLQVWGERNDVPVIAQHTGADSASVIYDAIESATARNVDVLLADTAGRLHTKSNLMDELAKVKRVMAKLNAEAPHEVLLVLDAGTGQNALRQVHEFNKTVGVTGLAITKLDGTAKGGVVLALCKRYSIPVRYIGVGEGLDDLQAFCADDYVQALLLESDASENSLSEAPVVKPSSPQAE